MKRREFIALLGGVAASWPLAAQAQSGGVRKIGVLMGAAPSVLGDTYLAAFSKRLEELGWVNGRNARTDVRWWTGGPDAMRPIVAEMLAASPDVIMVFSNLALAVLKPMAGNVPGWCSSASAIRSATASLRASLILAPTSPASPALRRRWPANGLRC